MKKQGIFCATLILFCHVISSYAIRSPHHRPMHVRSTAEIMRRSLCDPLRHITKILREPRYHQLVRHHGPLITRAIAHFGSTPGFWPTLKLIIKHPTDYNYIKGYLWELEHALEIKQSCPQEKIIALNKHMPNTDNGKSRQFDIITSKRWIECKNNKRLRFKNERADGLRKQFTQQQEIVDLHNKIHNTAILYQVSFKEPIQLKWISWFRQKHIATYVQN